MTDKTELKACPSGHNKKAVFKRYDDDHNDHQDVIYCSEINCGWQVSRWNSLGSEKEAKKELTKLWNTRPQSVAVEELRAEHIEKVEALKFYERQECDKEGAFARNVVLEELKPHLIKLLKGES